jgi:hypothetical protein
MRESQTRPPESNQIDRFRETARQLECDEDQERFEKKLGKIATVNPKPRGIPS